MCKRVFDFIVSLIALIICLPLFVLIGMLIKIDSCGKVFFIQERVGQYGKLFNIYKFRTMVEDAEMTDKSITIAGDTRITKVGKVLRKMKLDELPQLINVLKGEMSLVGPRPEVPKYVRYYNEEQLKVLQAKPGITDYASIAFRNENEILAKSSKPEEDYIGVIMPLKLKMNDKYLKNITLKHDIKVIMLTIYYVFFKKSIDIDISNCTDLKD